MSVVDRLIIEEYANLCFQLLTMIDLRADEETTSDYERGFLAQIVIQIINTNQNIKDICSLENMVVDKTKLN